LEEQNLEDFHQNVENAHFDPEELLAEGDK